MLIPTIALLTLALAQQPPDARTAEMATLKAGLGSCSADFTVKDSDGKAVYGATIHVRVRYGMLGIKRADLEVGTNSEGKARIEGLPNKAKPLTYDVRKDAAKAQVEQDISTNCRATYEVAVKYP